MIERKEKKTIYSHFNFHSLFKTAALFSNPHTGILWTRDEHRAFLEGLRVLGKVSFCSYFVHRTEFIYLMSRDVRRRN